MSDGMFMGRKFTIPYDTSSDKQVASMMRAQIVTRTATPGTVIQVGDTVMAYGVNPDQAKMGNLDINLRSFEQISNQAQEAVRRNIQWQYGEQVADSSQPVTEPIKKSWIRRLFGAVKNVDAGKKLYSATPDYRAGELEEPTLFTSQPAPKPAAAEPATSAADRFKQTQEVIASTPTKASPRTPRGGKAKGAAKAPKPVKAAQQNKPSGKGKAVAAAPALTAQMKTESREIDPKSRISPSDESEFNTAFANLAERHKNARPDWTVTREYPDDHTRVSLAVHPTGNFEKHVISYDHDTKQFTHTLHPAHTSEPISTVLKDNDALHTHVLGKHEQWAF